MNTLAEFETKVIQWAEDRGILKNSTLAAQCLKLGSEFGELCDNIAKGKDIKDDLGDMQVVIAILAKLHGTTLTECADVAWNDIKDRKGFLNAKGVFIKDTDKSYKQAVLDFEEAKEPLIADITISYIPIPETYIEVYRVKCLLDDGTIDGFKFEPYASIEALTETTKCISMTMKQYTTYLSKHGAVS
jgi:hypothetical protein